MSNDLPGPDWASLYTRRALAALPADLTTATPPVVDEAIRTLQLDQLTESTRLGRAFDALHTVLGETRVDSPIIERTNYRGEHTYVQVWPTTAATALETARALPADTAAVGYTYRGPETVGEALATIDAYRAALADIKARLTTLNGEYSRRGGWARYYRVNNSNGHVHTDTACRTTFPTTQWNWPTSLSDANHSEVVDAAGALTCLVCFPDVREEIVANRPIDAARFETPEQRDEREAREAEAKAKREAKIAKAATVDGSVLVVQEPTWREDSTRSVELKTARAAELRYVDFLFEARPRASVSDFAREVYTTSARQIAESLAAKEDTSVVVITHRLQPKVEKRIKRGY